MRDRESLSLLKSVFRNGFPAQNLPPRSVARRHHAAFTPNLPEGNMLSAMSCLITAGISSLRPRRSCAKRATFQGSIGRPAPSCGALGTAGGPDARESCKPDARPAPESRSGVDLVRSAARHPLTRLRRLKITKNPRSPQDQGKREVTIRKASRIISPDRLSCRS